MYARWGLGRRLLLNCHLNGATTITLIGGTQTQEGGWEGSSEGNWPCENWSHERNSSECQEHLYLLHIMYILPNTKSAWWHHFIAPLSTIKMMSSCALSNTYSYIFSRMLKDGSCWHRSSLNSVASCLERCCPVADTNALMKNLQLSTIYILFSCITYVCIHQCLYQIRNNQICQQLKEYTLCKNFPP